MSEDQSEGAQSWTGLAKRAILGVRGTEILPAKPYNLPETYDLSKFPEEQRDLIEISISKLSEYVKRPIIKDNFKNHASRREWRKDTHDYLKRRYGPEAGERFKTLMKNNKVSGNQFQWAVAYVDFVSDYLDPDLVKKFNLITSVVGRTANDESKNDGPTSKKRILQAELVSDLVVQALNQLGNYNPTQKNELITDLTTVDQTS